MRLCNTRLLSTLFYGAVGSVCVADVVPFRDEYPLKSHRLMSGGSATIAVSEQRVDASGWVEFDVRFSLQDGTGKVFNPFFNPLLPLPASVAVYDADHRYLGNCVELPVGSRRRAGPDDRVQIWPGGYAGARLRRPAGALPSGQPGKPLPPGKYYVQAIFYSGFVTFGEAADGDEGPAVAHAFADPEINFDRSELFRSNVVEIELLPPPAPATRPAG